VPRQAYSEETATIMNRLLHYNMVNSQHTNAQYAQIDDWDIVGKTGTTNDDKDCWYCGMSPYAVMATWTGFDIPDTINDTTRSAKFFKNVMSEYLKDKKSKEYTLSPHVIAATYNPYSGLIISTENVYGQYVGYYVEKNLPAYGEADYEPYDYDYYDRDSDRNSNNNNDEQNNGGNDSGGGSDSGYSGGGDAGGGSAGGDSGYSGGGDAGGGSGDAGGGNGEAGAGNGEAGGNDSGGGGNGEVNA
jgi:penicillin-binding protein 1A